MPWGTTGTKYGVESPVPGILEGVDDEFYDDIMKKTEDDEVVSKEMFEACHRLVFLLFLLEANYLNC